MAPTLDNTSLAILLSVLGVGALAMLVTFYKFGWFSWLHDAKNGKPIPVNKTTREFFPELNKYSRLDSNHYRNNFESTRYTMGDIHLKA
ncbi:hypothetical protein H072_8115 [Dactylellina haptotyla CBS 200.50]|uniref:Uncharacterized protein n=1 Tax=Dactylellina haptotyla (strain CBS 200.50) TaxID=1284197 RepID=S8BG99_DACHA|nr:hypothetical protein H072_8115 [Dactylellina haptotyla CBS 200.50]